MDLLTLVQLVILNRSEDDWVCKVNDKGMSTVNYVYRCLNYNLSSSFMGCETLKLLGWF